MRQSLQIAPGNAAEADENRRRARRQKIGEIARRRPVTVDMSMVRPVVRVRNDMAAEAVQDRYRSPFASRIAHMPFGAFESPSAARRNRSMAPA